MHISGQPLPLLEHGGPANLLLQGESGGLDFFPLARDDPAQSGSVARPFPDLDGRDRSAPDRKDSEKGEDTDAVRRLKTEDPGTPDYP